MDNVAVSKRNHTFKKANKENTDSSNGSKCSIRRDKTSAAPFKLTKNEDTVAKHGPLKAKANPQSTSGEAEKGGKTVQKEAKGVAPTVQVRQTHSRAFPGQQTVKHKVAEAPETPAAGAPSKSALGMYKGKIVQSKIGSIWRPTVGGSDSKTGDGNVMSARSKSVADRPGHSARKPFQASSKSAMDRTTQVTKPAVVSRHTGVQSARRPARAVPETLPSSRNANVAPVQGGGTHRSKPKILATNKQVNKPPVSSTLSQYRFTMENAEERRAKLADWLASKGKTFKRPALAAAEPSKTRVPAKAKVDLNPPAAQNQPEPRLEACKPESEGALLKTQSQTPAIMNTTLELLENSDLDPQDSVDDIVVNLCDVLEALATPSRCDELSQMPTVGSNVQMEGSNPHSECIVEGAQQIKAENVAQVKDEEEEGDSDNEGVMVTSPKTEDASVIKYSVKTTPYLQSVKRTIEEASTSRSRRKSNIKDLKFLTPVRRSCRIERNASRLPPMLVDPDPCVSSLAELLKLDDHPNAYIYRKNHALLEEQPDRTAGSSVNV